MSFQGWFKGLAASAFAPVCELGSEKRENKWLSAKTWLD